MVRFKETIIKLFSFPLRFQLTEIIRIEMFLIVGIYKLIFTNIINMS